jgi:hypothetical protein
MAVYEEIPVPGFYRGDTYKHDEIMYSERGWLPKDCTIGPNQEIIGGTLIARNDEDKMYYPYDPDGENGLDRARGVLWWSTKTGERGGLANIVEGGVIKLEKVRGYDAQALEQLGAVVDDVRGTFKF